MHFYQKIYINDKPLYLTNAASLLHQAIPKSKGFELFIGAFHRNFRMAKKSLELPFAQGVIIEDIDIDVIQKEMRNYFKPVAAGGGIVSNADGAILMIYRRGKWDLPKGKLDAGESIESCAVREVREETGLQNINLGPKIGASYHIYTEQKKEILKTTTWFHMNVANSPELIPQLEENIIEAKWVPKDKIGEHVKFSYQGIRDILHMANVI